MTAPGDGADEERTATLENLVGRRVGRYEIVRPIGAGGMGEVFEARDDRLGRRVALKFLPAEYSSDESRKARFQREARAASALDHPNICTVHDIGESEDGRLYIVMGYYEGETLKQRLRRGPLPPEEALAVVHQLARGLRRAHQAGITHRDIKPANVIVTSQGRALLLDFGVAKVGGEADLTRAGSTLGTPAYMSPEQARGEPTDHRTDVWSLGVLLYEMLTGERPFRADDPQAAIYAILHEEPEPVESRVPDVPPAVAATVRRMLAKEPAARPADAGALLAELGADPSGTTTVSLGRPQLRTWRRIGYVAAALLAAAGLWWGLRGGGVGEAPVVDDGRTSLAVLFFDNARGEAELDWLRTGITDMLITDLAQSPELEVLSTGRLYQMLRELEVEERLPVPQPAIEAMARQSAIEAVVRGSYLRAGGVLRIEATVEDAVTGRILDTRRSEGRGEESLFAVVDELSAAIRNRFEVERSPDVAANIQAVTTDSLEAWRFYSEGLALQYRAQDAEAIALFEKAVEIDPEFALALATLGTSHRNLGHGAEAREYTERALELADRLPIGTRLQLEAGYYGSRWSTYGKAIEVLEEAIERDPSRHYLHNNLANRYFDFERYDDAIERYELLIARGTDFDPTYSAAAWAHAARGRFETGLGILSSHLREEPDDWFGHAGLAFLYTQWGRLDAAAAALERAQRLRPADSFLRWNSWRLAVLREDWRAARRVAAEQTASSDAWESWRGHISAARHALYAGSAAQALRSFERAADVYAEPDAQAALAHAWRAQLLLDLGDPAGALRAALLAVDEGEGHWPELLGRFHASRAAALSGDRALADRLHQQLRASWERQPNAVEERQLHHLEGLLALDRGQHEAALEALSRAAALLPVEGVEYHLHTLPDHLRLWYALGRAAEAAGRLEEAADWYRRATEAGVERVEFPVAWMRSFDGLGRVELRLGHRETARGALARFADAWRDGDMDRERVEAALAAGGRLPGD